MKFTITEKLFNAALGITARTKGIEMKRLIIILGLLGCCVPAYAQVEQGYVTPRAFALASSTNTANLLEGVALNAAAATRTVTVDLSVPNYPAPYAKILVGVFYTYSAASTVTVVYYCSLDGTNYAIKTSRAIAAGAGTISLFGDTYTTRATDDDFLLELDVRGCRRVRLVLGGAGAGAGDLVDVQMTALAGK